MRALVLVVGLFALAGCSDPVADAERELAMIEKAYGGKDEICAAKQKVADAHLKAHDQMRYETAKVAANIACLDVQLDRQS